MTSLSAHSCTVCQTYFSSQSSLNRHLKEIHKNSKRNIVSYGYDHFNQKCLECKVSFKFTSDLREHLQCIHKMCMEQENLKFSSEKDFDSWINSLPDSAVCDYIRARGTKKRILEDSTYELSYYNCSRTGCRGSKKILKERKRSIKKQGTKKLQQACTSQIVVSKKSSGECCVVFHKTHYGHDLDLHHVKLSKDLRQTIASKLTSGVPISRILNEHRNCNGEKSRSSLLKRGDILNIERSLKINATVQNDLTDIDQSDDILVEEQHGVEGNHSEKLSENQEEIHKKPDENNFTETEIVKNKNSSHFPTLTKGASDRGEVNVKNLRHKIMIQLKGLMGIVDNVADEKTSLLILKHLKIVKNLACVSINKKGGDVSPSHRNCTSSRAIRNVNIEKRIGRFQKVWEKETATSRKYDSIKKNNVLTSEESKNNKIEYVIINNNENEHNYCA